MEVMSTLNPSVKGCITLQTPLLQRTPPFWLPYMIVILLFELRLYVSSTEDHVLSSLINFPRIDSRGVTLSLKFGSKASSTETLSMINANDQLGALPNPIEIKSLYCAGFFVKMLVSKS